MCTQLTEECITQRHRLHALHVQVVEQVRIQVEKDGHVDRLPRVEALLLEAEALDLAEVGRALRRGDAVGGDADDVLVAPVGGRVEGQGRLAGEHADLALLGHKLPGQHVGHGGVEGHLDALGVLDGDQAARDVGVVGSGAAVGSYGLATPAGGLANLRVRQYMEAWGSRGGGLPSCRGARSHR